MKQGIVQMERAERITMVTPDNSIGSTLLVAGIGHAERDTVVTSW